MEHCSQMRMATSPRKHGENPANSARNASGAPPRRVGRCDEVVASTGRPSPTRRAPGRRRDCAAGPVRQPARTCPRKYTVPWVFWRVSESKSCGSCNRSRSAAAVCRRQARRRRSTTGAALLRRNRALTLVLTVRQLPGNVARVPLTWGWCNADDMSMSMGERAPDGLSRHRAVVRYPAVFCAKPAAPPRQRRQGGRWRSDSCGLQRR